MYLCIIDGDIPFLSLENVTFLKENVNTQNILSYIDDSWD